MIKSIGLVFATLLLQQSVSAQTLTIVNQTSSRVSIGRYYPLDIVPSLCERGPCWETLGCIFVPHSLKAIHIRNSYTFDIGEAHREGDHYLEVAGEKKLFVVSACGQLPWDKQIYFEPITGTVALSKIKKDSVCMGSDPVTLVID